MLNFTFQEWTYQTMRAKPPPYSMQIKNAHPSTYSHLNFNSNIYIDVCCLLPLSRRMFDELPIEALYPLQSTLNSTYVPHPIRYLQNIFF